jgi:hypothetical protein
VRRDGAETWSAQSWWMAATAAGPRLGSAAGGDGVAMAPRPTLRRSGARPQHSESTSWAELCPWIDARARAACPLLLLTPFVVLLSD